MVDLMPLVYLWREHFIHSVMGKMMGALYPYPSHISRLLELQSNELRKLRKSGAITPFIVVPAENFHQIIANHFG